MHPGTRSHVNNVIRGKHSGGIMLHHQDGIAQVAEPKQGLQQSTIVPLVQADTGFIKDIHHAHETRADLGGQPNPLPFSTGERSRRSIQREIVQPHVE